MNFNEDVFASTVEELIELNVDEDFAEKLLSILSKLKGEPMIVRQVLNKPCKQLSLTEILFLAKHKLDG